MINTLIVDDNRAFCRSLVKVMEPHSKRCEISYNGVSALDRLNLSWLTRDLFQVAFVDIHMPGMSGIEFVTKVRSHESKQKITEQDALKIVMISSDTDKTLIMRAAQAGCNGFLLKPVDADLIEQELERLNLITLDD